MADEMRGGFLRDDSGALVISNSGIGAHVYHSANISIPHAAATVLTGGGIFDSVEYDTDGMHDPGTPDRLTVVTPGLYLIWARGSFAANSTGARDLTIKLNFIVPPEPPNGGIAYSGLFPPPIGSFVGSGHTPMTVHPLVAGDFLQLSSYQTSGGPLDLVRLQRVSVEFGAIRLASLP